jgi:hypothetical protein
MNFILKSLAGFFVFALAIAYFNDLGMFAPDSQASQSTRCPDDSGSVLYRATTPIADDCSDQSAADNQETNPLDARMVVRGRCRQIILSVLHNPRSADWDDARGWHFEDHGDGRYTIYPTLRATNAMGATIRTRFRCEVREADGEWSLLALEED